MTTLGFRYAVRERTRLALTAGGVVVSVVLTLFLAGVYRGAVRGSLTYVREVETDLWVGRTGSWNLMRTSGLLSDSLFAELAAAEGVAAAEPLLVALLPADVDGRPRTLLVLGARTGSSAAFPRRMVTGDRPRGSGQVLVDRAFARRAGLRPGSVLVLAGQPFHVCGVSEDTNLLVTQYAFVGLDDLRALLGAGDRSSFFLLRAGAGESIGALAARLESEHSGIRAYDRSAFTANNRREIETGFLPVLWAVAVLGIAAGGAVVALMTYAAVSEKRADYAVLNALGSPGRTCSLVVAQQAATAALVGGAAGLVLLAVLQRALPYLVPEVEFRLDAALAAGGVAGALLISLLGSLAPARLAVRIPPMEAFRR